MSQPSPFASFRPLVPPRVVEACANLTDPAWVPVSTNSPRNSSSCLGRRKRGMFLCGSCGHVSGLTPRQPRVESRLLVLVKEIIEVDLLEPQIAGSNPRLGEVCKILGVLNAASPKAGPR